MAGYRDDHDAALNRAEALESELAQLQSERNADQAKIAALEQKVRAQRIAIATGQPQPEYPFPRESQMNSILVWTVLAFCVFPALGFYSWYLANQELRAIELGDVNPSQRATISTLKVLSIFAATMTGFVAFGFFFALLRALFSF